MSTLPYFDQDNKNVKDLWRDPSGVDEQNPILEQPFVHLSFFGVLNQFPCVNWIADLRTQTYTFISNNTHEYFGFPIDSYINIGPKFQDSIKHPEDRTHSKNLLHQVWHVLGDIPPLSRSNFKFSHDYRIVKPDGKIIRILEQNSVFQQDAAGNITHLLGVCNDITEWKKTGTQLASLSSIVDKQCFLFNANPVKSDAILSRRELEILKLISEGHSSKFIADKLFISFHTVNTHRQKMIEKTKTRNASGLVQFAICNGLI